MGCFDLTNLSSFGLYVPLSPFLPSTCHYSEASLPRSADQVFVPPNLTLWLLLTFVKEIVFSMPVGPVSPCPPSFFLDPDFLGFVEYPPPFPDPTTALVPVFNDARHDLSCPFPDRMFPLSKKPFPQGLSLFPRFLIPNKTHVQCFMRAQVLLACYCFLLSDVPPIAGRVLTILPTSFCTILLC